MSATQTNIARMQYHICVSFPRTGILAILRIFLLKNVSTHCAKTKRGSLVFANVPENLGLCYHTNVTVISIALVKLVHNNP